MADDRIHEEDYEEEEEEEEEEGQPERPRRRQGGPSGGAPPRRRDTGRRFRPRRKVCSFCVDKVKVINYKDVDTLRRFVDDHGKIVPRRKTGTCAKHQRRLALAVKQARHLALLPFSAR
jgi:small subunit ribosomal protein S18